MRFLSSLIVFGFAFLCGCASHDEMHFKAGRGDAGQFILLQAVARGGQLLTTNELPAINGAWRYSEDQYGVVIRMSRDDYFSVERLLRLAFGEPKFGPGDTKDGGKLGGYRLTPKGGAIQFGCDDKMTQVIILRQLTQQESSDGLMKAMKEVSEDGLRESSTHSNTLTTFDGDETKFNQQLKVLLAAQNSYFEKGQTNEVRQTHKQIVTLIDQRMYPRAIHQLEQATNEIERFYALDNAAKESLNIGKKDEAKKYAEELSQLMEKYKDNWNYGNAVQDVNIVLGRLALSDGNLNEAKADLLKAGKSPGSPQMDSFGPNMSLAKELLEKGEKDTVLEYFGLCRKFWTLHPDKLDEWSQDVKAGKIPNFGANLEY